MSRIIFHIDVNSAYLSWTSVENLKSGGPDLRQIPSIIGGDQSSRHGIVLAKSLQAKACGVSTGEPVAQALKKCPNLTVAPPDHKLYKEYSRRLMGLLSSYTLRLEQLSIDECFLDVTDLWPDRQEALAVRVWPLAGERKVTEACWETVTDWLWPLAATAKAKSARVKIAPPMGVPLALSNSGRRGRVQTQAPGWASWIRTPVVSVA